MTQSIVSELLKRMARGDTVSQEDEEIIKNVGAVMFEGKTSRLGKVWSLTLTPYPAGTDTVCIHCLYSMRSFSPLRKALCTLLGTFLGVSLHPEVLKKAHAELDAVVGPHRMPNFGDRDSLVYLNAIIKESMRWHTALPIGIPHATVADDEFRGYFIPAGTMLIPNTWYVVPRSYRGENGVPVDSLCLLQGLV